MKSMAKTVGVYINADELKNQLYVLIWKLLKKLKNFEN